MPAAAEALKMLDDPRLEDALRRTFEANLRFYGALGQVTLDYLKSLRDLWQGAVPLNLGSFAPRPPAPAPAAAPAPAPPPPAPSPAPMAVLVLEAEAGHEARGVFVVGNRLARTVSAPVTASPFTDPQGREVDPPRRVEPEVVTLDPGAQTLVQIVVTVTESLDLGTDYRAEISIPGLSDSRVPVVLRRRAAAPAPPAPRPPATPAKPAKKTRRKKA